MTKTSLLILWHRVREYGADPCSNHGSRISRLVSWLQYRHYPINIPCKTLDLEWYWGLPPICDARCSLWSPPILIFALALPHAKKSNKGSKVHTIQHQVKLTMTAAFPKSATNVLNLTEDHDLDCSTPILYTFSGIVRMLQRGRDGLRPYARPYPHALISFRPWGIFRCVGTIFYLRHINDRVGSPTGSDLLWLEWWVVCGR